MNQILGEDTFEEVSNYKLTFEDNEGNLIAEDYKGTDEASSTNEDTSIDEKSNTEECTSLVELKENRLFVAQQMFKKSIKVSIKSFLISLSLSFLNLFI